MVTSPRYLYAAGAGVLAVLFVACATPKPTAEHTPQAAPALQYPVTSRGDVVDDYHGVRVADPYPLVRGSQRTCDARLGQRRERGLAALSREPAAAGVARRTSQATLDVRTLWCAAPRGAGAIFYLRNDGTQDQSVLYVADSITAKPRVLMDPNGKRDDADQSRCRSGSRARTASSSRMRSRTAAPTGIPWHFRRVSDGTDLPVILKYSKFWNVSWARDSSGVWYSRYPLKQNQSADDARGDDAGRPDVYYHVLGEPQSADQLVFKSPTIRHACRRRRSPRMGAISSSRPVRWLRNERLARAGPPQAGLEAAATVHTRGTRSTTFSGRRATSSTSRRRRTRRAVASSR